MDRSAYKKNECCFLLRYPLNFSIYFFLFFITGTASAFATKNVDCIPQLIIGVGGIILLVLILMLFLRLSNTFISITIVFVISILSFVFGYTYTAMRYYDTFKYPLERYAESADMIEGFEAKIISYNGIRLNRHVYIANVNRIHHGNNWYDCSSKIRLYNYDDYIFGVNDIITSRAKIRFYTNIFTNQTEKDENMLSMLENKSLVGVANAYNDHHIVLIREGFSIVNYFYKYFLPLRIFIKRALSENMTSVNYSIAQCLLIGDKDAFPYTIREEFQKVGISHILSVSGLHLSIISFLLFQLFSILPIPLHIRLLAISMIIIIIYPPMTLYSIPILRSSLMMIIAIFALLLDRSKNILNILLLTAFIMLLYDPDMIKEISFQFSFLATFSLIIYMPMLARLTKPFSIIFKIIIDFFAVSILANIILFPLVSAHFGMITLTSIIANIYAVPLTFAIIVLDIVIVILYRINPSFAILPSSLNNTLVDMMFVFSRWLGDKDILRYQYSMSFERAVILTAIMVVLSLIFYCLFYKKQFENLMK